MSTSRIIDLLSSTFAAWTDPTRYALLANGGASINKLAALLDIRLPALFKHTEVLEKARRITKACGAQWRQCSGDGASL